MLIMFFLLLITKGFRNAEDLLQNQFIFKKPNLIFFDRTFLNPSKID